MNQPLNSSSSEIDRLQDEVRNLNLRLEELNDKLQKSENYKSHFLSLVTNEIINPFTSILGLSKGIIQLDENGMEKARELAQVIYSEAFFLDFQLNNIFMAARLEAGEATAAPSKVDILSVIKNVADEFHLECEEKAIEIVIDDSSFDVASRFVTDPVILKNVVLNLVSNAIKASGSNNKIIIKIWINNSKLFINVQDFGVGIEPYKLQEMFDRFKKLDETINSINTGSGIGLPVVRGVLDLLHGKLEVESKVGEGSTFKVVIPEAVLTECGFATDEGELFFDMDDDAESF